MAYEAPPQSYVSAGQQYGGAHEMGGDMMGDDKRTLWVGDIDPWMDDNYLRSLFATSAGVVNAKVIRDKLTGAPAGYGFIEFQSPEGAAHVLNQFNNVPIPGLGRAFRLNWATFGINARRPDSGPEFSLFVGDVAPEVNDMQLQAFFAPRYRSVKAAKVVTDPTTGASRGYGFVRFTDETECYAAMSEMQGAVLAGRALRLSQATPKKSGPSMGMPMGGMPPPMPAMGMAPSMGGGAGSEQTDPSNTTIFVGNLDASVTEDELRGHFMPFGELVYVRVPPGKNCGFVQYVHRSCAENAILRLHGQMIGTLACRLSWGRTGGRTNASRPAPAAAPMMPYGYGAAAGYPAAAYSMPPAGYADYYGVGAGGMMAASHYATPYAAPVAAPAAPAATAAAAAATEESSFDLTHAIEKVVERQNEAFVEGHMGHLVPSCSWAPSNHADLPPFSTAGVSDFLGSN